MFLHINRVFFAPKISPILCGIFLEIGGFVGSGFECFLGNFGKLPENCPKIPRKLPKNYPKITRKLPKKLPKIPQIFRIVFDFFKLFQKFFSFTKLQTYKPTK